MPNSFQRREPARTPPATASWSLKSRRFGSSNAGGGISNSGTIVSAQKVAVSVSDLSTFYGNISNTGTIAGNIGIVIGTVSTFSGAIVNSGVIIGTGGTAIDVSAAGSAIIIDQNGGSVTGNILLSPNADVVNLTGGTIAGNIVGQGRAR